MQLPHEAIASDEYWAGATEGFPRPPLPAELMVGAEYALAHFGFVEGSIRKAKALYNSAANDGFVSQEITDGRDLSFPIDERSLLRIVSDARYIDPPDKKIKWRGWQTAEEFDELAAKMLTEKLYEGRSAAILLRERARAVRVLRGVSYLVAANSDVLMGFVSSELRERSNSGYDGDGVSTKVRVGEAHLKKKGAVGRKIIKADIIIPGRGSTARRSKRARYGQIALSY